MPKALFFISLMIIVACQPEQKQRAEDVLGEIRSLDPVRRPEDNEMVSKICAALRAKEGMLSVLMGQQYTFEQSLKSCSDSGLSGAKSVTTKIKKTGGNSYSFEAIEGDFSFSNIETATDGVMKAICEKDPYYLESPVVDDKTRTAIYWTTFTDQARCKSGYDALCVHLQIGTIGQNYSAKIHTNEWIKFKTADTRIGFFVDRHLVTNAGCQKKQVRETKAVLK
jgi:hypothetical protein